MAAADAAPVEAGRLTKARVYMANTRPNVLSSLNEDSPCTFRAVANRKVRFIWEITAKCNLPCWYCFRTDPSGDSVDQALLESIATQFDPDITDSVLLTGGEPFLLPNIPQLIALLVSRNIHVKVATNLTFNSNVLRKVHDIRQVDISTSIDGYDAASHDRIRGLGSVQKIRENVSYLREMGRPVSARCILTEQNILEVERVVLMALDIGFSSLTFSRLTKVPDLSTLNIDQGYDAAVPSSERIALFLDLIAQLREKYPNFPIRTAGFAESLQCCTVAGSSLAYITAHGKLHPCTLYRVEDPRLDLRTHTLQAALTTLGSISRGTGLSTCPSLRVGSSDHVVARVETMPVATRKGVGAVIEYDARFLLVHKVKAMDTSGGPIDIEGEWVFPGGGVGEGEDIEMALRRELAEETGLMTYVVEKELPALDFEFAPEYRERSGFERQHTRMFLIRCPLNPETATQNAEIDAVQFFARADVTSALHHESSKEYFRFLVGGGLLT